MFYKYESKIVNYTIGNAIVLTNNYCFSFNTKASTTSFEAAFYHNLVHRHTVRTRPSKFVFSHNAMKEQLTRFLLLTVDMKKAIDRNSRDDEDLSFFLKQLDKDRKVTLGQLSRNRDAFKKQMTKRRESLSEKFKVQFSENRTVVCGDPPRFNESEAKPSWRWTGLRRASTSCVESGRSFTNKLPAIICKRHSLPVSPLLRDNSDDNPFNVIRNKDKQAVSPPRLSGECFAAQFGRPQTAATKWSNHGR